MLPEQNENDSVFPNLQQLEDKNKDLKELQTIWTSILTLQKFQPLSSRYEIEDISFSSEKLCLWILHGIGQFPVSICIIFWWHFQLPQLPKKVAILLKTNIATDEL